MRNLTKLLSLTCSLTLVVSLLPGCQQQTKADSSSSGKPVELSLVEPDGGRVLKEDTDNKPLMELENKANVKLTLTLVPQADYKNKYTVLASSGNLPDISVLTGFDYQTYASQGLYADIGSILDKNAPNLKKNISKDNWDLVKFQGKTYCVPYLNINGKYTTVFRQDWLDNLGLKLPTTLDEYKKVVEALTFNDPDKDGKNDTYGLGAAGGWTDTYFGTDFFGIFGAFGVQPNANYLKDNKIYNVMITDQYRQAIQYIKGLWDEKVIDPESFTIKQDQANQKLVQSKSGSVTGWWSTVPQLLINQLKMNEVNPSAKWTPLTTAVSGPGGKGSYPNAGQISRTIAISAKSKNVTAAVKFLDYLSTDDGWTLVNHGLQGEDWSSFGTMTDAGNKAMNEKWLDPIAQVVSRVDLLNKWNASTTDATQKANNVYIDACANMSLYDDVLYGVPQSEEYQTYNADLYQFQVTSFISFVTGATALTDANWNTYVDTWKNAKSGQKVLEAQIKAYNSWKGTKYTAGN